MEKEIGQLEAITGLAILRSNIPAGTLLEQLFRKLDKNRCVALGKWPIRPVCSAVDGERRGLYQFLLQFQKFYTNVMRWSAEYRTLYEKLFQAVIEMLVESKLVEEIESGHGRSFICLAPKYMETRTQRSIAGKRELMNYDTRN